jgi:uncharacterized protein (TIGR02285 family)
MLGILLLSAQFALAAPSEGGKEMTWLAIDFAPIFIREGPDAGTGYLDRIMATLQPYFANYQQHVIYGNSTRNELEMKRGGNTCTVGMLATPEREKFVAFGRPYMRMLPNGIITLKALEGKFNAYRNAAGRVVLAQVLADPALRLGVAKSRLYSGGINRVLQPYVEPLPAGNVQAVASGDIGQTLYDMMQRRRIDYMLGFAIEESYFRQHNAIKQPTVFLPVEEASELLDASFACARTPWGRQQVEEMDRHFASSPALVQKLRQAYESWLSPDERRLLRDWEKRVATK